VTDRDPKDFRQEIEALLAAALETHDAAIMRFDQLHDDELLALADRHAADVDTLIVQHLADVEQLKLALHTRDTIGVAKGLIMAALHCTGDYAFGLLIAQSQHENRRLAEVAREIVATAERGATSTRG
jgi:hypothetical protein